MGSEMCIRDRHRMFKENKNTLRRDEKEYLVYIVKKREYNIRIGKVLSLKLLKMESDICIYIQPHMHAQIDIQRERERERANSTIA